MSKWAEMSCCTHENIDPNSVIVSSSHVNLQPTTVLPGLPTLLTMDIKNLV